MQVFADRLRLLARKTDIVARYGGEEFVMMPDTKPAMPNWPSSCVEFGQLLQADW